MLFSCRAVTALVSFSKLGKEKTEAVDTGTATDVLSDKLVRLVCTSEDDFALCALGRQCPLEDTDLLSPVYCERVEDPLAFAHLVPAQATREQHEAFGVVFAAAERADGIVHRMTMRR